MRFSICSAAVSHQSGSDMRGLKARGHEILFLSQYAGKVEDYSDLHPVVIGYSRLFELWIAVM